MHQTNDNGRAILHNPEDYPEPDEFKPERYLKQGPNGEYEVDKSVRDPRTAAFGFGRRCVLRLRCSGYPASSPHTLSGQNLYRKPHRRAVGEAPCPHFLGASPLTAGFKLYSVVANILAAFTILPVKDAAGNPQVPEIKMSSGGAS
jgi:hypothetical protein